MPFWRTNPQVSTAKTPHFRGWGASAIALAAKSVVVAKFGRLRGIGDQDIEVDLRVTPHRLCPFYDAKWELLNGYPGGAASNPSQALGFRF